MSFTTTAGVPAITTLGLVKLLLTVAFAPIEILSAIVMLPNKIAPGPIYTLFPIIGAPFLPALAPILTPT